MDLIFFILISYGITNIIANEGIFNFIKDRITNNFFYNLINCPTCLGLYVGAFVYLFFLFNITGFIVIDIFFAGIISSGIINIIEHLKIKLM